LPTIVYVIAIVLIAAYLIAVAVAWGAVGEAAEGWSRHASLLGGLEALVYSAAVAVLGVTVQRPAVQSAERRAHENEGDPRAGRAAVAALNAKAQRTGTLQHPGATESVGQAMTSEFQKLIDTANNARGN
jgi:NADH:ubiquinone oxidoreductase subunit 6 (subunit J)